MMRITYRLIITVELLVIIALATLPARLTVAQTPGPGGTNDPCTSLPTPAAGMPRAGMMTGTPPMGPSGGPGRMGQFDLMFIDMMIPHHAGAVAMAQVALPRAEHPELRALSEAIIESQSAEIEQMQAWREQWFPDAPATPMEQMAGQMGGMMGEAMGGPMGQTMGGLMGEMMAGSMMPGAMMGTPGAGPGRGGMGRGMMMDLGQVIDTLCATTQGFDLAFIDAMIPHHQMAVMMATMATMRAEHPELRDLTQQMVEDQQREIEQMQAWRAAWSGPATPTGDS